MASLIISPTPYVVASLGVFSSPTSIIPAAAAISIIAVLDSSIYPYAAFILSFCGPITKISTISPPSPSTNASVVPSPPSANGLTITSASITFKIPSLIALPASIDVRLPFSESIAITTFILSSCLSSIQYPSMFYI